jgi:hypothetical protein
MHTQCVQSYSFHKSCDMFWCYTYAEKFSLDAVFTKEEFEGLPITASLFYVESEAIEAQHEVFHVSSSLLCACVCVCVCVCVCAQARARACVCMISVSCALILMAFNLGMIPLYPVIRCVYLVACILKLYGKDNKVHLVLQCFSVTFVIITNLKGKKTAG